MADYVKLTVGSENIYLNKRRIIHIRATTGFEVEIALDNSTKFTTQSEADFETLKKVVGDKDFGIVPKKKKPVAKKTKA